MSKALIGFKYDRANSNVKQFIDHYYEASAGDSISIRFASEKTKSDLLAIVHEIIDTHIYAFNTTAGTGNIKRSFRVDEGDDGELIVWADISIAPNKAGIPGEFNYAAYFDRLEFNSFIRALSPTSNVRYRPFFDHMERAVHEYLTLRQDEIIRSEMGKIK